MPRFVTGIALLALLAAMGLNAPATLAADEEGGKPKKQKMLEEFDTDGDGELSKEERKAARQARGERGDRAGRKQKMLEKFDADGDGKLSPTEREAAQQAMAERRGGRRARGGAADGPLRAMIDNPEQAFRTFDKNKDGALSLAEFQAMVAEVKQAAPGSGKRRGKRGARGRGAAPAAAAPANELE